MVLKLRFFEKYIRNTRKVIESGAGERWRRSFGLIMRETEKYYKESSRTAVSYSNKMKAKWRGHILRGKEMPSKTRY
jgi:hypothetical protein